MAKSSRSKVAWHPKGKYVNIDGDFNVIVYDVLGNVIHETKNNSIDLSNEKNGIYFIEITKNNNIEVSKIILNR